MYPVSDAFKTQLDLSHRVVVRAEILADGYVVHEFHGEDDDEGIAGGGISADVGAQAERNGSLQLVTRDAAIVPLTNDAKLYPLGNELRIWRGVHLDDGTDEWVPLITGPMLNVDIDEDGGKIAISSDVFDRSKALSSYTWSSEFVLVDGTPADEAILAIIADRFPAAVYATMIPSFVSTSATTPLLVLGGAGNSDPGKDVADIAASAGLRFRWDRLGNPVLEQPPDLTAAGSVASYTHGVNMAKIKRRATAEGVYSGQIVTGQGPENTSGPVYGEAWDDDPSSPTYRDGKFGARALTTNDPKVTTDEMAEASAQARLTPGFGALEQATLIAVPNPALDPLDVVDLHRPLLGIDGDYAIASLNIPLDLNTMDVTMQAARRG